MFTLNSKYDEVIIYAETIEQEAISQITQMANSPIGENAHIRIMPDAHAGAGCVIGTTMQFNGKICPNVVSVDIGCGVIAYHLTCTEVDLEKLDKVCREVIVSGQAARERAISLQYQTSILSDLYCWEYLRKKDYLYKSLGTLGGGNHFIELNQAKDGTYWLLIHSGSRNLGKQVAEYYQKLAQQVIVDEHLALRADLIETLKRQGRQEEIETELAKVPRRPVTGLEYLRGGNVKDYLHDMAICQEWAEVNRDTIAKDIINAMNWDYTKVIQSVHNYIDIDAAIIRKGAIAARKDELCLIPLNMRDGTLICRGKGNPEWNYSAPHGAGRLMSRSKAKELISLEDFQESMKDVYSSTVCKETIDESPFAYKDMEEIMNAIEPTVEIIERIIPVYNFKATT
jgi:RNA-splicing ligase RtcB